MRTLTNAEIACIENALRRAAAQDADTEIAGSPSLTEQFLNQGKMAAELADLFFSYPTVEISED
ncbi:hypothetical protein [Hyphomicrobium sp. MC8b]|uniref:hypothetical protein n=1 Tax=Hyphomicrobium sp. MC8b TaxID=300273 RepID=UPI00391B439F